MEGDMVMDMDMGMDIKKYLLLNNINEYFMIDLNI